MVTTCFGRAWPSSGHNVDVIHKWEKTQLYVYRRYIMDKEISLLQSIASDMLLSGGWFWICGLEVRGDGCFVRCCSLDEFRWTLVSCDGRFCRKYGLLGLLRYSWWLLRGVVHVWPILCLTGQGACAWQLYRSVECRAGSLLPRRDRRVVFNVVTISAINTKSRQLCFWRTLLPSFNIHKHNGDDEPEELFLDLHHA
jgi:hypothetical protein